MRKITVSVLVWMLFASCAFAQRINLPNEVHVKPGEFAVLKAQTDAKEVTWQVIDPGLSRLDSSYLKDNKVAVFTSATPNKYRVVAVTSDRDTLPAVCWVIVSGVVPPIPDPPIPPPKPDPPIPPPVPPAKAWLVIVEESGDTAINRGKLLSDEALQSYIKSKNWRIRIVDKDVKNSEGKTPPDMEPYIKRTVGNKIPRAFVVDQDGTLRYENDLPAMPADVLKLLRKIGGDE